MVNIKHINKLAVGLAVTACIGLLTIPDARGDEKTLGQGQKEGDVTLVPEQDQPPAACAEGNTVECARWYSLHEKPVPDAWKEDHPAFSKKQRWYHVGQPKLAAQPKIIVLEGVNFDFDKANVRSDAVPILERNLPELQSRNIRVKVVGHTDERGTDEYNERLSERRAQAIRDYFIRRGIPAERLDAEGRGESEPIAANEPVDGGGDTQAEHDFADPGRAKNRRIELHITDVKDVATAEP